MCFSASASFVAAGATTHGVDLWCNYSGGLGCGPHILFRSLSIGVVLLCSDGQRCDPASFQIAASKPPLPRWRLIAFMQSSRSVFFLRRNCAGKRRKGAARVHRGPPPCIYKFGGIGNQHSA
jgi:hypothetical protein